MTPNKPLHLGLIGMGRMGKEVFQLASERGHRVVATFEVDNPLGREPLDEDLDALIHFSFPETVMGDLDILSRSPKPLVIGTTGWYDRLPKVRDLVQANGMSVLYAPNFSIGVAVFFRIVAQACTLFDPLEDYDVFLHECHHRGKLDSPSGTANALAELILKGLARKSEIRIDASQGAVQPFQLDVSSSRGGSVPGTHTVFFDSASDTIELRHEARNRRGFALGAVLAAEWLIGKRGLFTLDDFLDDLFRAGQT